ncbi:YdcH family protein [Sedimenticola sp.]|uniref:YdcH family protein n=1 Tax=Sedimenticola sp. TaxID=1940285 RepID=UPI003D1368B8
MLGETHDILHEFPNLEETINTLHDKDPQFASLMEEHDTLDSEIRNLEELNQPIDDFDMEEMKKTRALLKDQIYQYLRQNS